MMSFLRSRPAGMIGLALARIVAPLWVLSGALLKLQHESPKNLPGVLRDLGHHTLQIDLFYFLALLITLEIFAAAIMLFVERFARPMAIFVMSVFCIVLVIELSKGATDCGCLGGISPSPWVMLAIDGGILLGLIVFRPMATRMREEMWPYAAAGVMTIAGAVASFGILIPAGRPPVPAPVSDQTPDDANGVAVPAPDDRTRNPQPVPLPGYIMSDEDDVNGMIGKNWRESFPFQYMPTWPTTNLDEGTTFVVFYSRSCDHCEAMFHEHLTQPQSFKIVAIELPQTKRAMHDPGATQWDLPPTDAELMQFPVGSDLYITPPFAMRIEEGEVTCAQEAGFERCFGLE